MFLSKRIFLPSLLLILAACAPLPTYTPVLLSGSTLPAQEPEPVAVVDLAARPERYRDHFVAVEGYYEGALAQLDCETWVGPDFIVLGLSSELPVYQDYVLINDPKMIRIVSGRAPTYNLTPIPTTPFHPSPTPSLADWTPIPVETYPPTMVYP